MDFELEPRKICEICGMASRDSICDTCYPLVRARDDFERSRRGLAAALDETWPLDPVALAERVAEAKN